MKKFIVLNLLLLISFSSFCQYNSRPTRSRFYNSKASTFTISAGDLLLYTITKDSVPYNMVVTVIKYGNTIGFNYSIPDQAVNGNVVIQENAVKNAVAYDTLLSGNSKNLIDSSIFWLSKKNFTELAAAKETIMNLGNGNEIFKKQRNSTVKLNYKGKEKIVTVFVVENTNAKAKKSFWVLNEEDNPLILNMDMGWSTTLKEVR